MTRPISEAAIKTFRLLSEKMFNVSQRLQISPTILTEVGEILHHYLESIAERKFKSPELMAEAATHVKNTNGEFDE